MSSLSSRLRLVLPIGSQDLMSEGDDALRTNYDIIDLNNHCRIVTDKSTVTNPYNGQHIFDTIDSKNYVRKSGQWKEFATQGGNTDGNKGTVSSTTQLVSHAGTGLKILEATFTPKLGRKYFVKASVSFGLASEPTLISDIINVFSLRYGVGSVSYTSTLIAAREVTLRHSSDVSNTNRSIILAGEFDSPGTNPVTVGVFCYGDSSLTDRLNINPNAIGSGTYPTNSNLTIFDW